MKNPNLFPDRFPAELTTGLVGEDTRTAIGDLQREQWRSKLRQAYASKVGVLAAIRASNQNVTVLNRVLPTRLIGRFVKDRQESQGTHGYILEGFQENWSPTYHWIPNNWIHKLIFQYDLLQARNSSLKYCWHLGETFGDAATGFLRFYGTYLSISFDTDAIKGVAWGGDGRYVSASLKGRNNGYVVGGSRWPAETKDSILRFSYDGLIETQIGAKLSSKRSCQGTVGNRIYGFSAGGLTHGSYPYPTSSIERFTYFGEISTPRSILLGTRRCYHASSWQPGTKDVGYFSMGGNWRNFPTDGNPNHPIFWVVEQSTERLNLNTEAITTIAALITRPRIPGPTLSSSTKGWYFSGVQLTVNFDQQSPSVWWWSNQVTSAEVFNFPTETWGTFASVMQQPVRYAHGIDNQIR